MRDGDPNAARIGGLLNDPHTSLAVRAERAFLRTLRGGCQAPVGAHATYDGTTLRMHAAIAAADGSQVLRDGFAAALATVPDAEAAAVALATTMLAAGGAALIGMAEAERPPVGALAGLLFVLGRTQDRPSRIAAALREEGAEVVEAADGAAAAAALAGRSPNAVLVPSSGSVRAITEYLATLRDNGGRPLVVAMGPASAATASDCGWPPDVVAPDADIASFVQTVTRTLLENAP
jgi:CheY-like chemotaxis protein